MSRHAANSAISPLAVVILNWNLPYDTIACIESLQVGLPEGVRIVVVDNASTDGSVRILRSRFSELVEIIENDRNLGFAGGVNAAIRQLLVDGVRSIFFLNNDTVVSPDLLKQLIRTAETKTGAGIVGPVIYYHADPGRIWRFGDREHPWLPFIYPLSASFLARHSREPFQVSYTTGCGMLVRSEVFEHVGLFDERYFMYFEDADFCRRVRQAGFEIWVDPLADMWHKVSLSSKNEKPQMRYYQSWGRARFYWSDPSIVRRWFSAIYIFARAVWITTKDCFNREWRLVQPTWLGTTEGLFGRPVRNLA
ncbi:MAG TPA: glycosyltransferase family 2 protein [Anaerolineales bacterium]|nr:glycosyltransferase family 2 protein [Anaerolineales bacterium]